MVGLKKLQKDFVAAVHEQKATENIASEIKQGKVSKDALIGIYSNNLFAGREKTLSEIYPAVLSLVGEKFFSACAREYIKNHPSHSGNLDDYGENFSAFLSEFPPAKQLAYLADVARFEWLYHECYFSEEQIFNKHKKMENLSPEKFATLKFILNPSAQFFNSQFSILKIWQMTKQESPENLDIENLPGDNLIILKNKNEVCFVPLDKTEKEFLILLQEGKNIAEALELVEKNDPEFDLVFYVQKHLSSGTFGKISLK